MSTKKYNGIKKNGEPYNKPVNVSITPAQIEQAKARHPGVPLSVIVRWALERFLETKNQ